MGLQHGNGNSVDLDMQHGQVHAACPSSCPCCMSVSTLYGCLCCTAAPFCMSILHVHVHIAFPCLWCMSRSVLQIHVHAAVHVHDASPCPCYKSMSLLYVHVHAAGTWTCSIDTDMQHGYGHEACAGTCSMDMNVQHRHGYPIWT
jgi:hypothetical protein